MQPGERAHTMAAYKASEEYEISPRPPVSKMGLLLHSAGLLVAILSIAASAEKARNTNTCGGSASSRWPPRITVVSGDPTAASYSGDVTVLAQ
jgi:hypothetical protein